MGKKWLICRLGKALNIGVRDDFFFQKSPRKNPDPKTSGYFFIFKIHRLLLFQPSFACFSLAFILFLISYASIGYAARPDISELTPAKIEKMILRGTPYNSVIQCRQRALIARDYLTRSNYYSEIRINSVYKKKGDQYVSTGNYHAFIYWKKDGRDGFILDELKGNLWLLKDLPAA